MTKSYQMPEHYKETIRDVIRNLPNVTFIWKYERPEDGMSRRIPNLVESTWLPQNDLLYDPRISLFITHGGQGSITEATTAGVPLIVLPIFADHPRNAAVVNRIGTGIVLEKEALGVSERLEEAIEEALGAEKYPNKAKEIGEMLRSRPLSPSQTFLQHMEFLARFGPLRMLDHYGSQLNFVQYYLIDVFLFLAFVSLAAVIGALYCFNFLISLRIREKKTKLA